MGDFSFSSQLSELTNQIQPAVFIIFISEKMLHCCTILIMYMSGTRSKVWKCQPMGLDLPIVKIGLRPPKLFAVRRAHY